MRTAAIFLAFLLAGCSSSMDQAHPADAAAPPSVPGTPLPADIWTNGTLGPSFDFVGTGGPTCTPPLSECQRFPAAMPRNGTITAVVRWNLVEDDLDLYLMLGEEVLEQSNGFESRHEFLRLPVAKGDYEVVVSGSLTPGTAFELFVWFDEPRAPNP